MKGDKKMKKRCNFCGNKNVRNKAVQYIYRHNGHLMIVNNVPCEECEYCGEQYFAARVLKKIEKEFTQLYIDKKKPRRQVKVPVEEFAELR